MLEKQQPRNGVAARPFSGPIKGGDGSGSEAQLCTAYKTQRRTAENPEVSAPVPVGQPQIFLVAPGSQTSTNAQRHWAIQSSDRRRNSQLRANTCIAINKFYSWILNGEGKWRHSRARLAAWV